VPDPFLVMATQNPIESEGTYPLPEAQVDRFMLKVVVGYPDPEDELTVVERALDPAVEVRQVVTLEELAALRRLVERVYVDPAVSRYAVALAGATRSPEAAGIEEIGRYVERGASPRGSISLVVAARALALLRQPTRTESPCSRSSSSRTGRARRAVTLRRELERGGDRVADRRSRVRLEPVHETADLGPVLGRRGELGRAGRERHEADAEPIGQAVEERVGRLLRRQVAPDRDTLREIAQQTGGQYYDAPTADSLDSV
jgi:hypothetical protein